jgi:predicted RNA binding protein YcfA (HicA-like mRNA interferase family)
MNYKKVIKLIEDDGWREVRQVGSHKQFRHKTKKGIVTVAAHRLSDEIPPKTESSILKQAGLKIRKDI